MKKIINLLLLVCLLTLSIPASAQAVGYGTTLNNNQTELGEFLTDSKEEEYRYTFTTSNTDSWYQIGLKNTNVDSSIYAVVYDNNDVEQFSVSSGNNSTNNNMKKLNKDSTYFVKVNRYNTKRTGKFQITMCEIQDDVSDFKDSAEVLKFNTSTPRSLNALKDVDYFTFKTTENDSWYDVNLINTNIDSAVYAVVYDENDVEIFYTGSGYNSSSNNQLKLNTKSTYYIKVYGYNEYRYGKYQIKVTEIKDDVTDLKEKASTFKYGSKLIRKLNGKSDEDWYSIKTSNKDSWYYFEIKNVNIDSTTYLYVYDKNDVQIATIGASFNGLDNTYLKLNRNETYYVKVKGYNEYRTGKYQIKISEIVDDTKDTKDKSTKLALNKTYKKKIDSFKDIDYFKFTTNTKDTTYKISVSNYAPESSIYVEIFDKNDVQKNYARVYAKEKETIEINLKQKTTYYIKVTGNNAIGSYSVKIGK